MINPVSSHASLDSVSRASTQAPPPPKAADSPHDTVQLSSAAKAAVGDVDHDGDSH